MNSTPDPKETEPSDAPTGRADERLAHAHEQIKRADEQLTRLSEQLAKMERDDARPPPAHLPQDLARNPTARASHREPAASRRRTNPTLTAAGKPALRTPSACLWRRASLSLPWFCSRPMAAGSCCRPLGAAARFNAIIVAGKSAVCPRNPRHLPFRWPRRRSHRSSASASTTAASNDPWLRAAPQDAAPAAPAAPPDQTQLLQTIARDLANLERNIEQLKANQQQIASDNSKAIGELKASQEEMKRALAKVSEQSPPKASAASAYDAAGPGLAQARAVRGRR